MLTQRRIALFWLPLAATWVMMAAEGPFVAALIARLANATENLAAFGVALAFAMLVEAPIIMIMSAATALVSGRASFVALRRFTAVLNAAVTGWMGLLLVPTVFRFVAQDVVALPEGVARLAHGALVVMLPWPAAIGYRRFYQGVLIRHNQTRRVALGTVVRLVSMALAGGGLFLLSPLPGATVGGAALAVGVVAEAVASRIMAAGAVRTLRAGPDGESLSQGEIGRFYLPLALTSVLTLGVNPVVTFFVSHARLALPSLAVLPVVGTLGFIFRAPAIAFQEVGIALLEESADGFAALRSFAVRLGVTLTVALGLLAGTPLAGVWLTGVAGLEPSLASFSVVPLGLLVLMPLVEAVLALQRATLVVRRRTRLVTVSTLLEVAVLTLTLTLSVFGLSAVGAVAAAVAIVAGRAAASLFLVPATGLARRF